MRVLLLVLLLAVTAGAVSAEHWLDDRSDHRFYGKVRFYNPAAPGVDYPDTLFGVALVAESARYATGGSCYRADSLGFATSPYFRLIMLASGFAVPCSSGVQLGDTVAMLGKANTWKANQTITASTPVLTLLATVNGRRMQFSPGAGSLDMTGGYFHLNRYSDMYVCIGSNSNANLGVGRNPLAAWKVDVNGNLRVGDDVTGTVKIGDGLITKTAGSGWSWGSGMAPDGDNGRSLGESYLRWGYIWVGNAALSGIGTMRFTTAGKESIVAGGDLYSPTATFATKDTGALAIRPKFLAKSGTDSSIVAPTYAYARKDSADSVRGRRMIFISDGDTITNYYNDALYGEYTFYLKPNARRGMLVDTGGPYNYVAHMNAGNSSGAGFYAHVNNASGGPSMAAFKAEPVSQNTNMYSFFSHFQVGEDTIYRIGFYEDGDRGLVGATPEGVERVQLNHYGLTCLNYNGTAGRKRVWNPVNSTFYLDTVYVDEFAGRGCGTGTVKALCTADTITLSPNIVPFDVQISLTGNPGANVGNHWFSYNDGEQSYTFIVHWPVAFVNQTDFDFTVLR
jgi:hypothetical protein